MAKYYLSEKTKDSKFNIINISKIEEFSHLDYTLLKDVDRFTSMFTTKRAIKDLLVKRDLLDKKSGKLCISYTYNKEQRELYSDIVLYDDKKFIDTNYILEYTKENLRDMDFLNFIYNKYNKDYYKYIKNDNLRVIREYIDRVNKHERIDGTTRYDLHKALEYLFKEDLLKSSNGNINYRSLHDLGMNLSSYEKKKVKTLKKMMLK